MSQRRSRQSPKRTRTCTALLVAALAAALLLLLPGAALAQPAGTSCAPLVLAPPDAAARAAPPLLAALALQQATLTASDGAAGDFFGMAVAFDGDTALVGAPNRSSYQGAAYVFVRTGTRWSQQGGALTASDGAVGNQFGSAVALSGDTALVGAPNRSSYQGAAYVFTRTGTPWSQQGGALTASDGAAGDGFGHAVALSGDTALVGADGRNSANGAAYVFVRSGATWSQQGGALTESGGASGDEFGYAVALSGDTALIGDSGRTVRGNAAQGAAYVFVRSGATWSQQGALTASGGAAADEFGNSVALSGDTALIGAPQHAVGGNDNQGAAYVFVRSGASWSQQGGALTATGGAAYDWFGWSVALDGDTALIGAPTRTVGGNTHQGAAYVFTRTGTSWSPQGGALTASDGAANDEFGWSVALAGSTALIGVLNHAVGSNADQGSAYVISPPTITPSVAAGQGTISPSTPESVSYGTTPTFTFAPAAGYHIATVAVDGSPVSMTANSYTFPPVSADHAIAVSFAIDTFTITPSVAAGTGTVSPGTPQSVSYGATPSFAFAPAAGYHVATVSVDGSPVTMTAANTYTFPAVSADYTLAVSFATPPPPSTPTLHLKLSGLKHGALKLGKRLTAKGTVTPSSLAGGKVTLTVQRRQGSKWRKVKSVARTISASGAYGWKYKPAKKGSYRIQATIAKMATHTAAASKWRTFKVK